MGGVERRAGMVERGGWEGGRDDREGRRGGGQGW